MPPAWIVADLALIAVPGLDQATRYKPCSDPVRSRTRHGTGVNSHASFNCCLQVFFGQTLLEVDQFKSTALLLGLRQRSHY